MIKWSHNHLISTIGFPTLARRHLYIESGPLMLNTDVISIGKEYLIVLKVEKVNKRCKLFGWPPPPPPPPSPPHTPTHPRPFHPNSPHSPPRKPPTHSPGSGVTKPISSVSLFSRGFCFTYLSKHWLSIGYRVIFGGCRHSWAAGTPGKDEFDSRHLTWTFAKAEMSRMGKLKKEEF